MKMSYYVVAREEALTIGNASIKYQHIERKNNTYLNESVDLTKTGENYYFKKPDKSYTAIFHDMAAQGLFSTRKVRLKDKETAIGSEIIVAVAGDYFESREQAIEFFRVADEALNEFFSVTLPNGEKIAGKDLCMSSVIHADEGSYGMHYITCTCVPRELKKRRTKKELDSGAEAKSEGWYCQLSHSGFWQSTKDENGKLYYSYSKLNDVVAEAYKKAGYTDIERGKKGSTARHLHPNEYKALMRELQQEAEGSISLAEARKIGGKYILDESSYERLKALQSNIEKQYAIIKKSQEIVDKETFELKEARRKAKTKELEADKVVKDYEDLKDKYRLTCEENRRYEADKTRKEAEIAKQKDIIDYWEMLFDIIITAIKKILEWIKELLQDALDKKECERIRECIKAEYDNILKTLQTADISKEGPGLAEER